VEEAGGAGEKIEALKGKIFNLNENNENHKVYPSACGYAS
jgi:hypothetical protein